MQQEIYILDNEIELYNELVDLFSNEKDFLLKNIKMIDFEESLKSIPALFIVNEDTIEEDAEDICKKIRDDDDNNITPVIVISSKTEKQHHLDILKSTAEYFIATPMDKDYLFYTIKNILRLIYINRRISPLTGLPRKCTNTSRTKKASSKKGKFCSIIFRFRQL